MAERRARGEEPTEEIGGPTPAVASHPTYHQEHTVPQNGHVTIHGGIFSVKDSDYRWSLLGPKGSNVALANAHSAEPFFIATDIGDYVASLTTTEGRAEIVFHVVE